MKKRVADIIAEILIENNIKHIFSVVGGGAMFLNDAFGHHENLEVTFNHHEQACSMAAEGFARATGRIAGVCVTSGPGGTNTLTGVLGAYQDNYPMIIISGQVRYNTTADSTGLPLRFMGEQEHNIIDTVKPLTKFAVMVKKPEDIRFELEKAIYLASTGRKGPCWIDVPLNVQGALVEVDDLKSFIPEKTNFHWDIENFLNEIFKSERPVILVGSGVRSCGYVKKFRLFAEKLGIPVLAATYNADLMEVGHSQYYGNFGVIGGRAGNIIVQNADLVIGIGCRMAFRQIGFNYQAFSTHSRRMIIDVDDAELEKPTLRIDVPIHADIKQVIDDVLEKKFSFEINSIWVKYCNMLKDKFPIYQDSYDTSETVNPYYMMKAFQSVLHSDSIVVLGNSSIAGHVLQMGIVNENQRIINNMNCGSMGYDLPAAIGAAIGSKQVITLITGDGSIMMNLQELMTVVSHKLPIKVVICNNGGYRAIVRTQQNMFNGRFTGCSKDTGVSLPEFEKIAKAFDIPYMKISNHKDLDTKINEIYDISGPVICEVLQDVNQAIEPRVMSKKLDDGTIISPAIDDLYPFLDEYLYEHIQFRRWENQYRDH